MPTLRMGERDTSGLREALREHYGALIEAWTWTIHGPGAEFECPWPGRVAALEAGEPVEVAGFDIPAEYKPTEPCRWGAATRSDCRRRRCVALHDFDRFIVGRDGEDLDGD